MQATASGYPTPEVQSTCCEGRVTDTSQGNLWVSLQKKGGWVAGPDDFLTPHLESFHCLKGFELDALA